MYLARVANIRLLPDALIDQIAAGEVVERPASVVKELVENSLDADARSVRVELTAGGRDLVTVEDNGCGMDRDDALLALERHATSKITNAEDLARISTLGFRGEALPSIAAAAHLTLETAAADGEGSRVEVEFGRILGAAPCARPRGTRVVVRDLFTRLPARRKFLRTEGTELRHAVAILTGLAFTHPEVAFILEHGRRTLLHLPPVREPGQRLPDLVGAQRARDARPFRHAVGGLAVSGFLLPPSGAREIVIAVNGRVVRDRLLVGAVNRALRAPSGAIEADAYLHLTVPTGEVDVNVHPTKAEVRFLDPGRVTSVLTQALAAARVALHGPIEVRRVVSLPPASACVRTEVTRPGSRKRTSALVGWTLTSTSPVGNGEVEVSISLDRARGSAQRAVDGSHEQAVTHHPAVDRDYDLASPPRRQEEAGDGQASDRVAERPRVACALCADQVGKALAGLAHRPQVEQRAAAVLEDERHLGVGEREPGEDGDPRGAAQYPRWGEALVAQAAG